MILQSGSIKIAFLLQDRVLYYYYFLINTRYAVKGHKCASKVLPSHPIERRPHHLHLQGTFSPPHPLITGLYHCSRCTHRHLLQNAGPQQLPDRS